ncbi:hypothetical protein QR680_001699 [Steinernema hermaphroditum]|uniref:Uncharacterized protein n=1 Tax=Steinernema hermaphroditum TaxID=289476 RepID=A0AA39GZF4_9BILA|nr:hypothetical protein QR680_001699 [Steinernema hermaphroditum]
MSLELVSVIHPISEALSINGELLTAKDPKSSTLSSRVPSSVGMRPLKDDSFPQFPNFQDDNMSVVDDTMSLATNASEDDQQWNNASALDSPNDDDIFKSNGDDEVAIAEEAETLDVAQQLSTAHKQFLSRQVNVLQAFLLNTNVYIAIADGQTRVSGYASKCMVAELLDLVCSNVYSSLSKNSPPRSNIADGNFDDAHINLKDLQISLTDEILAHLGPFVEFEDNGDQPPNLVISISNTLITTKDPKKKQPLRIQLKDVEICQFADDLEGNGEI